MFLFQIFKRRSKRVKLKEEIFIEQEGDILRVEGKLSKPTHSVKGIKFHTNGEDNPIFIENQDYKNHFKFIFNLREFVDFFPNEEELYQLSLIVNVHGDNLSEKQLNNLIEKPTTYIDQKKDVYEYPIRLGRFESTLSGKMESTKIEDKTFKLYKSVKGNISLAVNKIINQQNKVQIDYFKSRKHKITFGGKLFTRNYMVERITLLIKGRETNEEYRSSVNLEHLPKSTRTKFGLNRYKYSISIDLNKLFQQSEFCDDIYDFYFELKYDDLEEVNLLRIGNPRFLARYNLKSSVGIGRDKSFAVSPYYTVKRFNLSIQAEGFEHETYKYLRRMMRWAWLIRPFYKRKNIWIIGERPYKAQDTGYSFFKHMREKHPERDCYYVIEKDSPELDNVEGLGNILYYKSKQHVKYTLLSSRVVSSHHPDYLYPLRTKDFMRKMKAKKVFIQHGILGTKNIQHFYGKESPSFNTDLFLVSSDLEKNIVVSDLGYDLNEVKVTGLSRFDSLLKQDVPLKRQLLIIPTWREWLVRDDIFLESEYYQRYKELVFNDELHKLATENNFEVVFCLHPNMQKFTHYFEDAPVRIINQGEVDVQRLLKQSAMMITDYSSVAFDFSFLNKPILYYQFDRGRFIGKKGSHLDLNNDFPGELVFSIEEVLSKLSLYAKTNFETKEIHREKASKFLKYNDLNSSERIYNAIKKDIPKKTFIRHIQEIELYKVLFKRFRRSKYYFPTMKLFYKVICKIMPVDKKLILFESGIGKQYGDSPKNIYDEIVRRNLNYKKIWVNNKNVRFSDLRNTKKIKRLSPSYFYYLARAGVWVNNQNFPTYIKKRNDTIYLQTWHGTPLKRMLHDIDVIMGRTDDYLERVSNAIKNWDYLISPSDYASNAFRSAFKYQGEIMEVGYPRNDVFYSHNSKDFALNVKSELNIPSDKKVILYAPTFRDNQTAGGNKFSFDIPMDLYKMQEELGEEYIILLRMHVVVKNKLKIDLDLQDFVMDVSNYPDMQNLLLLSDILITDYSSSMFDFANTKKPMLFYTYDFEIYKNEIRGFYMDFEKEAPGPLLKNTEEIIDSIINIEALNLKYDKKYDEFYKKYCGLEDGSASKRVVDYLFDKQEL